MPDEYTILLDAPGTASARMPLARLGDYNDQRYGPFKITSDDVASWQKNLERLPGGRALIDEDHLANKPSPHRNTKASGWITGVELDGQQAYANVEWTPRGEAAIANKEYLFASPTFGPYTNDAGERFANTLTGAALTNKPFLTSMPQITLASDEAIQRGLEMDPAMALMSLALDGQLGEDYQNLALEQDDEVRQQLLETLTSNARSDLKDSDFAIPDGRHYPIQDLAHARNALARVAQNGTPAEQTEVKAAVYRRYPDLKPTAKKTLDADRRDQMFTKDTIKTLASIAGITDEAEVEKIVTLAAEENVEDSKVLEAIEAAKPAPPAEKTLEEMAEAKGVKILSSDDYESLDADAKAGADAKRQLEEQQGKEPTKTLEELAAEAGHSLIDPERLTTLEQAADKVPGLEVAVKRLADDAADAQKQLESNRFEQAYDEAERVGKAIPAQRERMKGFFELNADSTLKMLEEQPQMVNVQARGANVTAPADNVPAGQDPQHYQLEQDITARMQEKGEDYATALEAITGVHIPTAVTA